MDHDTRSWLVGVPFASVSAPAARERVALSSGQKRELASFTGLVMASTVFFLTPLLVAPAAPVPPDPQLVHTPLATPPALRVEFTPVGAASATPARRARAVPAVLRGAPLPPERAVAAAVRVRAFTVPKNVEKANGRARRKGISGGLIRALVGSGRYRVQPFPTPASGD